MSSTYSTSLRLELITTGEQSGSWGTTTNTNLGTLLEEAIGGYVSVTHDDSATDNLTATNGAADEARNVFINVAGTLTAERILECPAAIEKTYIVKNATSGGFDITFGPTSGTRITVPNGRTRMIQIDGTNAIDTITDLPSGATVAGAVISVTGAQGDDGLDSIAGLTTAADKMIYTTALDTYAVTGLTATGRSILDDASVGAVQTTLSLVPGTDIQAWDTHLDDIAALTATDGNFIVGNGSTWVAEATTTVRTSLGLGTGDSPQFTGIEVGHATDSTLTRVSAGVIAIEGDTIPALATANEWTAAQNFNETTLTSSSNAVAWDAGANQVATHTLTENTTVSAPTNIPAGRFVALRVIQHASAAKTLAWNAVFKWGAGTTPTMTVTVDGIDIYVFWSNGTNLHSVGYTQAIA